MSGSAQNNTSPEGAGLADAAEHLEDGFPSDM